MIHVVDGRYLPYRNPWPVGAVVDFCYEDGDFYAYERRRWDGAATGWTVLRSRRVLIMAWYLAARGDRSCRH